MSLQVRFFLFWVFALSFVFPQARGMYGAKLVSRNSNFVRYVAAVEVIRKGKSFGCTANVVSSNFVLTAGHCLDNLDSGQPVRVHFYISGFEEFTIYRSQIEISVTQVFRPNEYFQRHRANKTAPNPADLALLELDRAVPAGMLHFEITNRKYSLEELPEVPVAGFGYESHIEGRFFAEGDSLLRWSYRKRLPGNYNMLLFDVSDQVGTCDGDSGGPIFIPGASGYILLGIISARFSPEGAEETCHWPDIGVDLSLWSAWIHSIIDNR